MLIEFVAPDVALPEKTVLAILVFEGQAATIEGGAFARAVAASRFTGTKGQTLDVLAPEGFDRVLLVGVGKPDGFDAMGAETAAASAYNAIKTSGLRTLRVRLATGTPDLAARAALGLPWNNTPRSKIPYQLLPIMALPKPIPT